MSKEGYKIGEFAKNLGVTPDLLKHYESFGLLEPTIINEAGYRTYSFPQSGLLLQCLRMRNLGFTLKEMKDVITDYDFEKIIDIINEKKEDLLKQDAEIQAKLRYIEYLNTTFNHAKDPTKTHYCFQNALPFYYFDHTNEHDFIDDALTREVIKEWVPWIPIVESTYVFDSSDPECKHYNLGLSISCEAGDAIEIFKNEKVQRIDLGFCLINSYYGKDPRNEHDFEHWAKARLQESLDIVKEHNFKINGPIYQLNYTVNREDYNIWYTTIIPVKA